MSENQEEKKPDIGKENPEDKNSKKNSIPPIKYEYEILSEDYTNFDLSFKLIVIGDSGVGKSCLTNNAVKNIFTESYNATVGFEFFTFNVKLSGKIIKLQIWDTCGQELYRSLITNFYRNASLAIMVYAINDRATFENIEMWLRELRTHSNPDAKVFLIGNKVDLEKEREITTEQGENYSKQNKLDLFMEASAKTGLNTQNIFLKAAELLFDNYNKYQNEKKENENEDNDNKDQSQVLRDDSKDSTKGCC